MTTAVRPTPCDSAIDVPSGDRCEARAGAGSARRPGESPHTVAGIGAICRSHRETQGRFGKIRDW
jgi:hypothetical protein